MRGAGALIGLYHGPHDSNVAVALSGMVLLVVPLSIPMRVPHFGWGAVEPPHVPHMKPAVLQTWNASLQYMHKALQSLGFPHLRYQTLITEDTHEQVLSHNRLCNHSYNPALSPLPLKHITAQAPPNHY